MSRSAQSLCGSTIERVFRIAFDATQLAHSWHCTRPLTSAYLSVVASWTQFGPSLSPPAYVEKCSCCSRSWNQGTQELAPWSHLREYSEKTAWSTPPLSSPNDVLLAIMSHTIICFCTTTLISPKAQIEHNYVWMLMTSGLWYFVCTQNVRWQITWKVNCNQNLDPNINKIRIWIIHNNKWESEWPVPCPTSLPIGTLCSQS